MKFILRFLHISRGPELTLLTSLLSWDLPLLLNLFLEELQPCLERQLLRALGAPLPGGALLLLLLRHGQVLRPGGGRGSRSVLRCGEADRPPPGPIAGVVCRPRLGRWRGGDGLRTGRELRLRGDGRFLLGGKKEGGKEEGIIHMVKHKPSTFSIQYMYIRIRYGAFVRHAQTHLLGSIKCYGATASQTCREVGALEDRATGLCPGPPLRPLLCWCFGPRGSTSVARSDCV